MFGSVVQMLGWAVPHFAGDLGPGDLALQQVEVKGQYITVSLELLLGLGEDKRQNLERENNVTSQTYNQGSGNTLFIKSSEQLCLSSRKLFCGICPTKEKI